MIFPRTSRKLPKRLATALVAIGIGVTGICFGQTPASETPAAPDPAATTPEAPAPAATAPVPKPLTAGATQAVRKAGQRHTASRYSSTRKKSTKRTRYRRKATPLRLPAVTQYGIPRLHVKAAYVVDSQTNRVLFQKNPEQVLPIASLSKLMTAMIFLRTNPDWDRVIEIVPVDVKNSSRSHLRPREEITVRDLIHAMLMSSDNVATKALVRTCGVPYDEFIHRMNLLADSLGMSGTHYVEPTGLSEQNVSTAQDVARILSFATQSDVVSAITQKPEYEFTSNRHVHRLINTNRLLRSQWTVTSGKTGYIHESGYCLATTVKGPDGADVTAIVLGAPSNALRFAEARRILDWTFRFGLALPESKPESD
jgi:D-alanyl-D-alanine endopeptidase (penicillin-binding protein 7)